MKFKYVTDVLSADLIEALIKKHCDIFNTDEKSHDTWDDRITNNKKLPIVYATQIIGKERTQIQFDLFNRAESPFYNIKDVKHCDVAIQKYPPNSELPFHLDTCIGSLTLFLNKHWEPSWGGEFIWKDTDGAVTKVSPCHNAGIYVLNETQQTGLDHGVCTITGPDIRYTLQVFMRKPGDVNIRYSSML